MADYKNFLTSFSVFGKTSDFDVQKALKSVIIDSTDKKLSESEIQGILDSIQPIEQDTSNSTDLYALAQKAMIINNQIAVKAISLSDQKSIIKANYDIIDVSSEIQKTKVGTTSRIIKDIEYHSPSSNYINTEEVFKSFSENLENQKTKIDFSIEAIDKVMSDYIDKNPDLSRTENRDWFYTQSANWLKNVLELDTKNGNNYRFNFTMYHNGTSSQEAPMYGRLNAKYFAELAISAARKLIKYQRVNGKFTYQKKSYFDNKAISFKPKNMALKLSATDSTNVKNKVRVKNNPFVRDLLAAGADLNQNMFDVYLRFNSIVSYPIPSSTKVTENQNTETSSNSETEDSQNMESTVKTESDTGQVYTNYLFFVPNMVVNKKGTISQLNNPVMESTFKDVYALSVRTANVGIPMITRESTTEKFLNTSYERPSNLVTFNNEGTLSIDCDANTYVNDMFLALSGLQRDGKFRKGTAGLENIQNNLFDRSKGHYPFMSIAKQGWERNTVDIVVSSHGFSMFTDKSVNPGGGGFYSNILYVFKDVRFIGVDTSISFNTESSSSLPIDVKFIFKNLETYYKPDNLGYAVTTNSVVRSSIFNAKNLNNDYYDETSITESVKEETDNENSK